MSTVLYCRRIDSARWADAASLRGLKIVARKYRRFPRYMVGYALASSARDRLVQIHDQSSVVVDHQLHRRGEDHCTALTPGLGSVQRDVRISQHVGRGIIRL